MKKRNAAIGGFLLLAVGTIGVGFSALTDSLSIGGTVGNSVPTFRVEFVDRDEFTKHTETDKVEYSADNQTATFTVRSLSVKNDTAVATLEIKNVTPKTTNLGAKVSISDWTISGDYASYFKVEDNWTDKTEIEPEDSITFNVTFTCLRTSSSEDPISANISATVSAEAVERA